MTDLSDKLEVAEAAQTSSVPAQRSKTLYDLVKDSERQFANALPAHVSTSRFVRLCLTALRTVPKLLECEPQGVLAGMMKAAQLGLEIDDVRGQAYLIPRWNSRASCNEATFQIGYKGLIDLAGRGGITVRAREVRAGDTFEYAEGLDPVLRHIPTLDNDGDVIAYYAIARCDDWSQPETLVLGRRQMETIRDRFASTKKKDGTIVGPWTDHFDAMARKTVIRRLLNSLPLPVELRDALVEDDDPIHVDATVVDIPIPPDSPPEAEPGTDTPAADESVQSAPPDDASSPSPSGLEGSLDGEATAGAPSTPRTRAGDKA